MKDLNKGSSGWYIHSSAVLRCDGESLGDHSARTAKSELYEERTLFVNP